MKYGFFPGCSYRGEAGYKESVELINSAMGIELHEIEDWNCCGTTPVFSLNEPGALALSGRVIALAGRQGFKEIVTTCNACYTTLRKTVHVLSADPAMLAAINERLAAEKLTLETFPPIRHYLEVLYHDIAPDEWQRRAAKKPPDIKVAAYYGCQLTRPWADRDHPERPVMLDRFLQRVGYPVVEHSAKTLCCGASHLLVYEDKCRPLIARILKEARKKGADVVSTLCPMCQLNLDSAQAKIDIDPVPVTYFTQLAGLVLGFSPKNLGMGKLIVPFKPKAYAK